MTNPEAPPRQGVWDWYFLRQCYSVSKNADCRRRMVGAIIAHNMSMVSYGFNRAIAGSDLSCTKGDCPRGLLSRTELPNGSGDYSNCIAEHAEAMAIKSAGDRAAGATLYCTDVPCAECKNLIDKAGIVRVVTPETDGIRYTGVGRQSSDLLEDVVRRLDLIAQEISGHPRQGVEDVARDVQMLLRGQWPWQQ